MRMPGTAASKTELHDQRREQKERQTFDDMRPQTLALHSSAIRQKPLARSPHAESKPAPHQEHRRQQRPENDVEHVVGVHRGIFACGRIRGKRPIIGAPPPSHRRPRPTALERPVLKPPRPHVVGREVQLPRAQRRQVAGPDDLDPFSICTSYVERNNLTIRTLMRRFTRLSLGFSKKLENLAAAVALHVAHYNFCRVHSTLKMTPAMAAGVVSELWTLDDLLAAI
jgi:hypothetical protein